MGAGPVSQLVADAPRILSRDVVGCLLLESVMSHITSHILLIFNAN
jgi:hypothetical protein